MIPFGRCVLLWRLNRGLSQAALAHRAGIPQPNLSDVERGEREVSLRTLRALALALDIQPGLLADGIGPDSEKPMVLSRPRLERIAQAVAKKRELTDLQENDLARKMTLLLGPGLRASGAPGRNRTRKGLSAQRAWLSVTRTYSAAEMESLMRRITEKAQPFHRKARSTHSVRSGWHMKIAKKTSKRVKDKIKL